MTAEMQMAYKCDGPKCKEGRTHARPQGHGMPEGWFILGTHDRGLEPRHFHSVQCLANWAAMSLPAQAAPAEDHSVSRPACPRCKGSGAGIGADSCKACSGMGRI
jgi:hypothetical protein